MTNRTLGTGIADLDELIGGLLAGDNVVWVGDDEDLLAGIEDSFLDAAPAGLARTYVTTLVAPEQLQSRLGVGVEVLDARPRQTFSDPMALEQALLHPDRSGPLACMVVDGLHHLVRRWGSQRALAFFTRVCPRMFESGAIAYWRIHRQEVNAAFVEGVRKVTQCVFELRHRHLHVVKAEGRRRSLQGQLFELTVADDAMKVSTERALGRVARGLERVRRERKLSQTELAGMAGVSQAAISQAEAGRRGLSLDTVLVMCDALGMTVDELVAADPPGGYVLARRERLGGDAPLVALLDDPTLGMRAYLVRLAPGQSAGPPFTHKGIELVVVASGLVQLTIGDETPVMRSGDAALATNAGVTAWRNLAAGTASFFWILRD